jgi:hypothetical protein
MTTSSSFFPDLIAAASRGRPAFAMDPVPSHGTGFSASGAALESPLSLQTNVVAAAVSRAKAYADGWRTY